MQSLESQLREMYGRVAYTHKTHEKMADGYISRYACIKKLEIALSALSSSTLIYAVLGDSREATILGAIVSTVLLGLTLYFKEASLGIQAQKHTEVAAKMWALRETLLSLLVDMHDGRDKEEIRVARDEINTRLADVYKNAPRTNSEAYAKAQVALKDSEELYFSDEELDKMLPPKLRWKSPLSGKNDD